MKDGRVHEVYNFGGLERTTVSSPEALAPGRHTIVYQFTPDSAKPGDGGTSRLSVDGKQVDEKHVPRTMPFVYSADEGIDVGTDNETPVTEEYKERRQQVHRQDSQGDGRVEVTCDQFSASPGACPETPEAGIPCRRLIRVLTSSGSRSHSPRPRRGGRGQAEELSRLRDEDDIMPQTDRTL